MKPFPHPGNNIAFQFDYITPRAFDGILSKFLPAGVGIDKVYSTGPAPVLLRSGDWRAMIEKFEEVTNTIEGSKTMRDKMGWLREMYTFSVAAVRRAKPSPAGPSARRRPPTALTPPRRANGAHARRPRARSRSRCSRRRPRCSSRSRRRRTRS